ncbi:MAG TPA: C40 family peptidase [Gemmatimonadales bacterium]|nr:C40 family peptidase [Gemmatimonadales bacterium]
MRELRRPRGGEDLTGVVATAAIAPLLAEPSVRAEQVSQLVLGETAELLTRAGEWLRLRACTDRYEGWTHAGYLRELEDAGAAAWREAAEGWSDGALLDLGGTAAFRVPLRARLALTEHGVRLPDGRSGRILDGRVRPLAEAQAAALALAPPEWAARHFPAAPYQWGGITPWGVDCSGLTQTTFAVRGIRLPRDAADQACAGTPVALDAIRPGDLLFFRGEDTDRVTHVAVAAAGEELVHAAIACGGVVREPWGPGTRAAGLRARLVAVRRVA